jgi:putative DNA primase/helicase
MDFANFCRDAGLIPGDILADGRWRRCPTEDKPRKRNGSYKLTESGTLGFCQNFAIHAAPLMWKSNGASEAILRQVDQEAIRKRLNDERRKQVKATQAARTFYLQKCKPLIGNHPYLQAHGLDMTGCYGLKVDPTGWLVVPMLNCQNIMSIQRISPDGKKLFWPDAPTKGTIYPIDRQGFSVTVICEGLATGLAIFACVPTCRVLCAFSAGNLANVPIPLRGLATIAADNDSDTEAKIGSNPGVKAATEASSAFGCGVAIPTSEYGTDWCDFRTGRLQYLLTDRPKAREADLRRAVDAEINTAIMRTAKFIRKSA